ncbi:MAG: autotransporter-associated beta strand repeat-containing protein [Opitutaceae bacterium]|jgi:autotransporter-associated beta strand protein|nr:autotransporter-associated beta strand repeat-containing protein [Opitutaceae bacterium]
MKTSARLLPLPAKTIASGILSLTAALFQAGGLYAQNIWNGSGVESGTTGTDWTAAANYTADPVFNDTTDWDFSRITNTDTDSGITLSDGMAGTGDTYAVKDIYFARTINPADPAGQTTGIKLALNGNGTPGATTIDLRGNIYLPVTNGSIITLGSDLTLNLSNHAHSIRARQNANVASPAAPVLVINALITGGGSNAKLFNQYSAASEPTPALVLTNDNNSFIHVLPGGGGGRYDAYVGYTSVSSVGGGNSSVGRATTADEGRLVFGNGANFNYIGTTDQATDRELVFGGNTTLGNASDGTTLTFTGAVTTATGIRANVISGATMIITSDLGGTTTVSKQGGTSWYTATGESAANDGGGLLVLGGNNTYTGATTISAGTVRTDHVNALGSTDGATAVSSGATLDLNGMSGVAENVSITGTGADGAGALVNTNTTAAARLAGAVTLTGNASVGGAGDLTLDGDIGQSSGARAFTKAGAGTLFVNGTASWTGTTTVSAGALGGTGTIASAATFAAGTTLRPGTDEAIGQLTFANNLTLDADAIFSVTLNQASGDDYDRVAVGGTTALNGASLSLFFGDDFAPTAEVSQTFAILTSDGALSGQFGQGTSISVTSGIHTYDFGISYAGNVVTLELNSITAVPESATIARIAGLGVLACCLLWRRLRRARRVLR